MMSRKWVFLACLGLCALSLTASASVTDPDIISGAAKINSLAEEELIIGSIAEGALTHVDRTFVFTNIADVNGIGGGIDVVRTAVDDKAYATLEYSVTVNKAGTLLLFIDNRVGDNDATNPPLLGNGVMDWVGANGFTETAHTAGVLNPADQSVVTMTAWALDLAGAGTTHLYELNNGTSRLTYLIGAIPDGYNVPPAISHVPASAVLYVPTNQLVIDYLVSDFGENTATTVLWEQTDTGPAVTIDTSVAGQVTLTFPGVGNYTIQATVTDGEGLSALKTVQVSVKLPEFKVEATDYCEIENDSATARRSNPMYVKNYDTGGAQRRRIGYHRYNISSLKQEGKVFANTYLTYYASKKDSTPNVYVYPIREELDGFTLNGTTWSTAPGVVNNPMPPLNSLITAATLDWADIYPLTLTFPVPAISTWYNSVTSTKLDEVLNSDTDDSIVLMFVAQDPAHNACELQVYTGSTIEPVTGLKGIILRGNMMTPEWAWDPKPANFSITASSLAELKWSNPPQPAGDITCDVYFGSTEPNSALPHYGLTQIASGISGASVAVPYALVQYEDYYWIVDVHDSGKTPDLAAGNLWTFNTSNAPPTVDAGDDQYEWFGHTGTEGKVTIALDGDVSDDGLPAGGTLTRLWTQVSPSSPTYIDPNGLILATGQTANTDDVSFDISTTGTYVFQLKGDDSSVAIYDTVQVIVESDACEAAKSKPDWEDKAFAGDLDNNCYVNMADFVIFAKNWLECSSLAPCTPSH